MLNQIKVKILVSHPIPYFVPLWRELNKYKIIDLQVFFFSKAGLTKTYSKYFNKEFKWDVNLLDGYNHKFISYDDHVEIKNRPLGTAKKYLNPIHTDILMVHGYVDKFSREGVRYAKKKGIQTILRGPITSKKKPSRSILKRILRDLYLKYFFFNDIDYFLYLGKASYKEYVRLGVTKNKLFHSYYTVDYENFENQKKIFSKLKSRKELNIKDKTFVIIIVGAINSRKNHNLLLRAIEHSKFRKDLHLLIVGDGPKKKEILNNLNRIQSGGVTFVGFVNQLELGKYYLAADLFVFPSLYDSWGLVLNEAIQFGLPVLVSNNVSSGEDLVIEGKNGYLFDPNDHIELANKIDIIYNDKLMKKNMSIQSLSLSKKYNPTNTAEQLSNIFKTILNKIDGKLS